MEQVTKCKHSFEVAIWEYRRIPQQEPNQESGKTYVPMTPTHSAANVFYCKHCLMMVQLDDQKYKDYIKKGENF